MLLLFFGLAFTLVGAYVLNRSIHMMRSYVRVEGIIKDVPRSPATTRVRYAPLVSFKAQDGKEYSFFDEQIYRSAPKSMIGRRVTVCYNPDAPSSAVILSASLLGLPIVILATGLVVIGIACIQLL